jgi:hypothetical protein
MAWRFGKAPISILCDTKERVENLPVELPSRIFSRLVAHESVDEGVSGRLHKHPSEWT